MKRGNPIDNSVDNSNNYDSSQKRSKTDDLTLSCNVSLDFINKCKQEFNSNQLNILARNAVTSVGAFNAAVDVSEENKSCISQYFKTLASQSYKSRTFR